MAFIGGSDVQDGYNSISDEKLDMEPVIKYLTKLRVGRSRGQTAPNKPCFLLAIIAEIQAGHITSATISIDTRLLIRYYELYEKVTGDRQAASPWLPLWHLGSDHGPLGPLWQPELFPHLKKLAQSLGQPRSMKHIDERFSSAKFDTMLFEALLDEETAHEASTLIIAQYFEYDTDIQQILHGYMIEAFTCGSYLQDPDRLTSEVRNSNPHQLQARSAAFRTLVLEAYDFRCAASRRRCITPDYRYLTEAAHLISFAESNDDRPVNGLALTPDLHWAMDNHLLAPGPDLKWHVSQSVDPLVADNEWLCRLDSQQLHLPREARHHPHQEGLCWRMDHLLR